MLQISLRIGKAMQNAAQTFEFIENRPKIRPDYTNSGFFVAYMKTNRQVKISRYFELPPQNALLNVTRTIIIKVIQTNFTNADDFIAIVCYQLAQFLDVICRCIMRVNTDDWPSKIMHPSKL